MKLLKKLAYAFIAGYGLLALYAGLAAHKRIFPAPASTYREENPFFRIPMANGYTLGHIWEPTAPPNGYLIVYNHGNRQDLGMLDLHARRFAAEGFRVLAYEYPGYGPVPGPASEERTYAAAQAAYQYAQDNLHLPPEKIIFYGYSLGSGPATEIAARYPLGGLILEGAFTSTFRTVTRWKVLPWDIFDNYSKINQVQSPILLIHGEQDRVVKPWHSRALAQKAQTPTFTYFVPQANHINPYDVNPDGYRHQLASFMHMLQNNQQYPKPTVQ